MDLSLILIGEVADLASRWGGPREGGPGRTCSTRDKGLGKGGLDSLVLSPSSVWEDWTVAAASHTTDGNYL